MYSVSQNSNLGSKKISEFWYSFCLATRCSTMGSIIFWSCIHTSFNLYNNYRKVWLHKEWSQTIFLYGHSYFHANVFSLYIHVTIINLFSLFACTFSKIIWSRYFNGNRSKNYNAPSEKLPLCKCRSRIGIQWDK